MGRHTNSQHIDAPPEVVFDLWTNLERQREWIGGVTDVVDVTGPANAAGTTYTVMFGRTRSPTQVLEEDRPRRFVVHFGNWILRGRNSATFEPDDGGTLITVRLDTEGVVPESWLGSSRSDRGGVVSAVSSPTLRASPKSTRGWPQEAGTD